MEGVLEEIKRMCVSKGVTEQDRGERYNAHQKRESPEFSSFRQSHRVTLRIAQWATDEGSLMVTRRLHNFQNSKTTEVCEFRGIPKPSFVDVPQRRW